MGEGSGMPLEQLDDPAAAIEQAEPEGAEWADDTEQVLADSGDQGLSVTEEDLEAGPNQEAADQNPDVGGEPLHAPPSEVDAAGADETQEAHPEREAIVQDVSPNDFDSAGEPADAVTDSRGEPQHSQASEVDAAGADETQEAHPDPGAMVHDVGSDSVDPGAVTREHDLESAPAPHLGAPVATEPVEGPRTDESPSALSDQPSDGAPSGPRGRKTRVEQLEREGEVAADFLERLLDIADLDGDIDVDIDGDRAAVAVVDSEEGRVPRRLVGPDGRVLEALQELTRLAVQTATGERSRLMLDVGGFRAERRSALVDLARSAIAEVKESGQQKALADMTAFERKVVHDEVTAAGLVSESEGVEPYRHIVILPSRSTSDS